MSADIVEATRRVDPLDTPVQPLVTLVTLVTIVTPLLNRQRFLTTCIESVLSQDHPAIEHLFIDGGSTDGSLDVLKEYSQAHPNKIRFISESDKGACDAWNKGWILARGEILGWLGADDFLESGAIKTVVDYFATHSDASFVYGECNIVDESGAVIGRYATADFDRQSALNSGNGIAAMAAFYRRSLIDDVGPLRTDINLCDCDFFIRASEKCTLHRLEATLSNFRLHPESVTKKLQNSGYLKEQFLMNRQYGGSLFSPVCVRYYSYLASKLVGKFAMGGSSISFARISEHNFKRVAVFGAALTGRACQEELNRRSIEVIFFVDNFPPPGKKFLDLPVYKPANVSEEQWKSVDAVVIASSGRNVEMKSELRRLGIKKPRIDF